MIYTIIQDDISPDTAEIRAEALQPHKDYLAANADKVVFAGPMFADDGDQRVGSLTVVDVPDYESAEAFAAGDPFTKSGLFKETRIVRLRLGPPYMKRLGIDG